MNRLGFVSPMPTKCRVVLYKRMNDRRFWLKTRRQKGSREPSNLAITTTHRGHLSTPFGSR